MARKKIWMMLLLIGIASNFACSIDVDYSYNKENIYMNSSAYSLEIYSYDLTEKVTHKYNIGINESLIQPYIVGMETNIPANTISFKDSIDIVFQGERIASFSMEDTSKYNPLNGDNMEREIISKYKTQRTYIFTNSDFENAIPIEE